MKSKKELLRVVKPKDGDVFVDLTGKANGRGAYICKSTDCFEKAYKTKRFSKNLQAEVTEEMYLSLKKVVEENEPPKK